MSARKQFEIELNHLFHKRTHSLLSEMNIVKLGKPPSLDPQKLNKSIEKLQDIATKILAMEIARPELRKLDDKKRKRQWHNKKEKGWRVVDRMRNFSDWYESNKLSQYCIYIFWDGRKCIYLGSTTQGKNRILNHFEKRWFQSIKRIDVYSISNQSEISKIECLALHFFTPLKNKNRSASKKWRKKCPICRKRDLISYELKKIFKFK
ncbi:MAG: hypothetical protein MUP17_03720 [candidate division Zixibacteria bacterium]|nr:hypothetical protein [candidate division Zixibacteria bacterium]